MQRVKSFCLVKTLALSFMSASTLAQSAFEHDHQHHHAESKAHVHGQAELSLNLQDETLTIELIIPAMDAVGFEQVPRRDEEKEKIREIETLFSKVDSWIIPASEASCRITSNTLTQPYETAHEDSHKHDNYLKDQDADKQPTHSDFVITGQWHCAKASALHSVRVHLFEHLPNLQSVNVKWIRNGAAGVSTLTAKSSELSFKKR